MNFPRVLSKLINLQDLTHNEGRKLMEEILQGNLSSAQIAAVLTALRMKGESVDEIVGFIEVIREHMVKVAVEGLVIDTCGTGGDGRGTFNISTAVAIVVAGAGVKVAKHGNRAVSSKCGSADVLEVLGVNINLNAQQAKKVLEKVGMVFLFAPLFHHAFKHVIPVRKELKIPTVFNYLGPFVNPAGVTRQIIGVPNLALAEKLARVAIRLNYEHVMIVSGRDGLDEISIGTETDAIEIRGKQVSRNIISPHDFGIEKLNTVKIKGGDCQTNAQVIRAVLNGMKGPYRDVVVVNASSALVVAGKANNIYEGLELANQSIDLGYAKKVLKKLIFYTKKMNMNRFLKQLTDNNFSLIAEVKLRSPKEGDLGTMADFEKRIVAYERGGANAISLVVEKSLFRGSLEMIAKAKKITRLPILAKDFIKNTKRLDEIKKAGADAVLLIAKIVSLQKLQKLVIYAQEFGMEPVVEIFNEFELKSALETNTNIIAVNARDLNTYHVNVPNACKLLKLIPKSYRRLGFSGVETRKEIEMYKHVGADGVLIGTILMKSQDPLSLLRQLRGG